MKNVVKHRSNSCGRTQKAVGRSVSAAYSLHAKVRRQTKTTHLPHALKRTHGRCSRRRTPYVSWRFRSVNASTCLHLVPILAHRQQQRSASKSKHASGIPIIMDTGRKAAVLAPKFPKLGQEPAANPARGSFLRGNPPQLLTPKQRSPCASTSTLRM